MEPTEQRDALLRAVFFDDPDGPDLGEYVRTHFAGNYAEAVRFAAECVRSRAVIPCRPVRADPKSVLSNPDQWAPDLPDPDRDPD